MAETDFSRRVEATVEYKSNLAKRIDYLYPLIRNEKDIQKLYPRIENGEDAGISFASFEWTGNYSDFERKVLFAALDLASKDPDTITYCRHAKLGHNQTFEKAISLFQKALTNPEVKIYTEVSTGIKETGRKLDKYRFELSTEWIDDNFVRPKPYFWALDINSSVRNRKDIEGKIRSLAIKEGIPFSIVAGIYCGMMPKDIIAVFEDPNFRRQLKFEDKKAHIPNVINNNYKDLKILNEIHNEVMDEGENGFYPVLNSQGYKTAIEIMKGAGWIQEKDISSLAFEKRELKVRPKVVLLSTPEVAMQVVDENFKDNEKSKHIYQVYGQRVTTKVITTFLEFKNNLPKHHKLSS